MGHNKDPNQSAPYPNSFPQGGYPPPPHGGYPQQGGYPPPPYGGYPQQGGYPPPPHGGYPQQGGYPPPPNGGYPKQGGHHPPSRGGYSQQGVYPPPSHGGYPQQGGYPPPPQNGYNPPGPYVQVTGDYIDREDDGDDSIIELNTFSEKSVRMAFIRKVYAILMVQLAVTGGFIAVFVLNEDVKLWARANRIFFFLAIGINLVTYLALVCCEKGRRKFPGNFICLAVFTIADGFVFGFITSLYKADSVLLAVGVTAVICLSLTIFAFQTKLDFTVMGGALLVGCIVLILFGILTFFLPRSQFPILHLVYACCGAFLFSLFLIYDTQLMIGGNHRYSISPEEYIFAALEIYVDITQIFYYMLKILGERDN